MKKLITFLLIGIFLLSFTSAGIERAAARDITITYNDLEAIHSWNNKSFNANFKLGIDGDEYLSTDLPVKDVEKDKIEKIDLKLEDSADKKAVEWGWYLPDIKLKKINISYGIIYFDNFTGFDSMDVIPQYEILIDDYYPNGYPNKANITGYTLEVDGIQIEFLEGCKVERVGVYEFNITGEMDVCLDPISRSGSDTTINGYKEQGTAEDNPYTAVSSYTLYDADKNWNYTVSATGTAGNGGNCAFSESGTRYSLEDNSKTFETICTGGSFGLNENTGQLDRFRGYAGADTNNCWGTKTIWYDEGCNDNYTIYNWTSPSNWSNHFAGNIVVIKDCSLGDTNAEGQARFISHNSNNTLFIETAWETDPANCTYDILYSPIDVVNNNPSAGTITYQDLGRRPAHVEITDELICGNDAGGLDSGFGWGGYSFGLTTIGAGTGWTKYNLAHSDCEVHQGEWSPNGKMSGKSAIQNGYIRKITLGTNADTYDSTSYSYNSESIGGYPYMGGADYSYYNQGTGGTYSWFNKAFQLPTITASYGDYMFHSGGPIYSYWDAPSETNVLLDGLTAVWLGGSGCHGALSQYGSDCGHGYWGVWAWATASNATIFHKYKNNNWSIEQNEYYPRMVYNTVAYGPYDLPNYGYHTKTFDITFKDTDGNPIENVSCSITNGLGDSVAYKPIGILNENLTLTETVIQVLNSSNFSVGQTIRINMEYMNVTSIPDTDRIAVQRGTASNGVVSGHVAWTHYVNTSTYDNNIYLIESAVSNSNGSISQEVVKEMFTERAHEVYHNCTDPDSEIKTHYKSNFSTNGVGFFSNETTEPDCGSNWGDYWELGGTDKFPYENNTIYRGDGISYSQEGVGQYYSTEDAPYVITCTKPGYFKYDWTGDLSIDSTGVDWEITMYDTRTISGVLHYYLDAINQKLMAISL